MAASEPGTNDTGGPVSVYETAARAAGFEVRTFGKVQKIARGKADGVYVVSANGWRYACEDAGIKVKVTS